MEQDVAGRFASLEKRSRILITIVILQAICMLFLCRGWGHESRGPSEENKEVQTFNKIRANSLELVSSFSSVELLPSGITLSSALSSHTTDLSAYSLAFRENGSPSANGCILSPTLFYMQDPKNGPMVRMSITDNSSEIALFGGKKGGKLAVENNSGRPSIRLYDSPGNIRAILGNSQLQDDKGTEIIFTESTITLFDPNGNVFFQVPK